MEGKSRSESRGGRPRLRWFLLALVVSLSVAEVGFSVSGNTFPSSGLNPASLLSTVVEQVNLTYARGVRLVNGLRLIYEVHSDLRRQEQAEKAAPTGLAPHSGPTKTCSKQALLSGRA